MPPEGARRDIGACWRPCGRRVGCGPLRLRTVHREATDAPTQATLWRYPPRVGSPLLVPRDSTARVERAGKRSRTERAARTPPSPAKPPARVGWEVWPGKRRTGAKPVMPLMRGVVEKLDSRRQCPIPSSAAALNAGLPEKQSTEVDCFLPSPPRTDAAKPHRRARQRDLELQGPGAPPQLHQLHQLR